MRAIMVMFDTLNRRHLAPYGCDWVRTPNFDLLARRAVTFDQSYVCSMPCMPARRDFHTGRPNFLHRSWGPLEPFDDSVPQMLQDAGVHSALITDHQHYFEDGGGTYHTRYSSWQFHRGQEGDAWMGQVADPPAEGFGGRNAGDDRAAWQDRVNRQFMRREADQPQARTFEAGLDFIRRNAEQDRWFLQLETFDPHEPFFTQRQYQDLYREMIGEAGRQPIQDWPRYGSCPDQSDEVSRQMIGHYAALVTMCDKHLGDVLDVMDELALWDDTMLIVWTDHGFLLGEHECWAKCAMPFYDEVAHTPFFVWDPRSGKRGERRQALVQPSIDLGPTLLDAFDLEPTEHMTGQVLARTIAEDTPVRDAAMFGIFGGQLNVTDGRYVYMRGPATEANGPLFDYTLMPTRMRQRFTPAELAGATLAEPLSFTQGCPVLKVPVVSRRPSVDLGSRDTRLYDLHADAQQVRPIQDEAIETRMAEHAVSLMQRCDAPAEQYQRLGLTEAEVDEAASVR